jgi:methyl-accepting chemotaxis protein
MTIRRFRLFAFLGFLLLIAASVAVTLWALRAQQDDAVVINLAGRQRMFIQQTALKALDIQVGDNPASRRMLRETADAFEQTLEALMAGGPAPYTNGTTVTLPPTRSPAILAQLEIVRATWDQMDAALTGLLENDPASPAFIESAAAIGRLSPVLLAQMDEAVRL